MSYYWNIILTFQKFKNNYIYIYIYIWRDVTSLIQLIAILMKQNLIKIITIIKIKYPLIIIIISEWFHKLCMFCIYIIINLI